MGTTTVSNKAWSSFKDSDYDLQQWIRACLIHPDKPSESKSDYKLPVREPDGTLNKNGVYAAASALAGGRGGISATSAQKADAAKKLISLYDKLNADPPESIKTLAHSDVDAFFLQHFGIKGQKWGVRRANPSGSAPASEDATRVAAAQAKVKAGGVKALSTKELQDLVLRMNLEKQFRQLQPPTKTQQAGKFIRDQLLQIGKQELGKIATKTAVKYLSQVLKK